MKISNELKNEIRGNIQALIEEVGEGIEISIKQCIDNLHSFRYWQSLIANSAKCSPLFLKVYKEGCNDKHIDRLLDEILEDYSKYWDEGYNKEAWISKEVALNNHKRNLECN